MVLNNLVFLTSTFPPDVSLSLSLCFCLPLLCLCLSVSLSLAFSLYVSVFLSEDAPPQRQPGNRLPQLFRPCDQCNDLVGCMSRGHGSYPKGACAFNNVPRTNLMGHTQHTRTPHTHTHAHSSHKHLHGNLFHTHKHIHTHTHAHTHLCLQVSSQ